MYPNIALVGYFGEGNFGDDLLACYTIRLLCGSVPPAHIAVSSDKGKYLERWFPGVRCLRTRDIMSGRPRRVVFGGGGTIYAFPPASPASLWGLRNSTALGYWRKFGLRQWRRTRSYAFCIGVGPLAGSGARWISRRFLRHFEHISVRDETSSGILRDLGIRHATTVTDPVCGMATSLATAGQRNERSAGFVVRHWPFPPGDATLLQPILSAARQLRGRGWTVEFISFHPDADAPAIRFLTEQGEAVLGWNAETGDITGFCGMLAGFQVMVAMRAHGVLIGTILGVPVVTIGLEPKLRIFAERWSRPEWIVEPPCSPSALHALVETAATANAPTPDWERETRLLEVESRSLLNWIQSE